MTEKFKNFKWLRFINLAINSFNFLLKGFFFVLGAKYLNIHDLGEIGVIFAYNTILVFFLGFEYWYFFNRMYARYLTLGKSETFKMIFFNQIYFYILMYLLFLPVIFYFYEVKFNLGFVLCIGIVSFHLIQEISRIWVYLNRQILSSLTTLSLAIWTVPIYFLWLRGEKISLYEIINIYTFVLFSCMLLWVLLFGIITKINLLEIFNFKKFFRFYIHKKAIRLSCLMLVSVLCYKAAELSPRLFADFLGNYKLAGAVTFYQSFGLLIVGLVYYIVPVFFLPEILKKVNSDEFRDIIKRFKFELMKFSLLFFIIATISPFIFVRILKLKQEYEEFWYLSFVFGLVYFIINLSTYYSYVSYVRKADKVNYLSNILTFLFVLLVYVISYILKLDDKVAIVIALSIFSVLQYLTKGFLYKRGVRKR